MTSTRRTVWVLLAWHSPGSPLANVYGPTPPVTVAVSVTLPPGDTTPGTAISWTASGAARGHRCRFLASASVCRKALSEIWMAGAGSLLPQT